MGRPSRSVGIVGRLGTAAAAWILVAGLLSLPAPMAGSPAAGCCGSDCSPCPVSFCKTTRADRAVVPAIAALAFSPQHAAAGFADARHDAAPARPFAPARGPSAFYPMRN